MTKLATIALVALRGVALLGVALLGVTLLGVTLLGVALVGGCSSSHVPEGTTPSNEPGPSASPTASADAPDLATMCPVLADTRAIGGTPASVAPAGAREIDLAAIRAAPPTPPPGWTVTGSSQIARGMAGHASSEVSFDLARGEDHARVFVADLVHVCRCATGDGVRLRDHDVAMRPNERSAQEIHGAPAYVERVGEAAGVEIWVADRCRISVRGGDAETLVAIADGLAWSPIETACAAR